MPNEPKACFEIKIRCGGDTLRIIEGYASTPLFFVNAQDIKVDTEEKFKALCKCLCKIDSMASPVKRC